MSARWTASLLAALLLSGCAGTAIERNFSAVESYGADKLGAQAQWLQSEADRERMGRDVERMLDGPLSLADAQRIALGYSPAFQIALAEAAAESADATRSARIANPVFTFEHLVRKEEGERDLDIGRALGFSLFDVLLLPWRMERADFRQQQARLQASAALVAKVGEVRQAWVGAVAAAQLADYHAAVVEAAEAGAVLAERMQAVGSFSRLERAREQLVYADAVATLARARQAAVAAREALVRELGLPDALAARLVLPERLPDLPETLPPRSEITRAALDERLDVRMARAELEWMAGAMGVTRVTSVVDGMHVAVMNNSETGEPRQRGYEVELPLPIFDFGDATRAGAQARYMAALNVVAQRAREAASQVREAYAAYRTAWELARHYRDEVVPLRETISEEMLLNYNGMLVSVFELLADARGRVAAVIAAIEAQRDLWLAGAALQGALLGGPSRLPMMQASAAAEESGGGH